jgi:hypothetical protein
LGEEDALCQEIYGTNLRGLSTVNLRREVSGLGINNKRNFGLKMGISQEKSQKIRA